MKGNLTEGICQRVVGVTISFSRWQATDIVTLPDFCYHQGSK